MPIVCHLLALDHKDATALAADPASLARRVAACEVVTELYWFWHGIDFLLGRCGAPEPAHCLRLGGQEFALGKDLPPARLHQAMVVPRIATNLAAVPAEDLAVAYDPKLLDAAGVYPERWVSLSEEADLLGDLLEHYRYLQQFTARRKQDRKAMLVMYERIEDESGF